MTELNNNFSYKENSFFNEQTVYTFKTVDGKTFESKVHYEKGFYWTNESMNYKATSLQVKV